MITKEGSTSRGRVWTKKATSADTNAVITVRSSVSMKTELSAAAYRSSTNTSAVTASAAATVTTGATQHRSPAVSVAQQRLVAGQLLGRQGRLRADLDRPHQRTQAHRRQRHRRGPRDRDPR